MSRQSFIPLEDSNVTHTTLTSTTTHDESTTSTKSNVSDTVPWSLLIRYLVPVSLLAVIYSIVDSALMLLIPLHTDSKFDAGIVVTSIGVATVATPPLIGQCISHSSTEFVLLFSSLLRTLALSTIFYNTYISPSSPLWLWISVAFAYGMSVDGTRISVNHCISKYFPVGNRGRATAIINGIRRLGPIIGPIYVAQSHWSSEFSDFQLSLLITMIISMQSITVVCCLMTPPNIPVRTQTVAGIDHEHHDGLSWGSCIVSCCSRMNPLNWIRNRHRDEEEPKQRRLGITYVYTRYLKMLLSISVLSCGLDWLRVTRKLIITFHGQDIGLSDGKIGYVNSISWVPDAMMFPVAGWIMDKYGRKATAIPGLALFIGALIALPWSRNYKELMAVSIGFGIGNGITCGLLMTVAADIAPSECKADFIAGFRMFRNIPEVIGPVVISTLCSKVSLMSAAIGSAGIGGFSLLWTAIIINEPKYHAQKLKAKQST